MNSLTNRRDQFRRRITLFVALTLVIVGIGLASVAIFLTQQTEPTLEPSGTQSSRPSAVKPSKQAVDSYSVAATVPKYITIPAVGIEKTRVISLGVMENNQIIAPDNLYDTGWYNQSSKPGQPGAMFIYGHINSLRPGGVFKYLHKLQPGDQITVTRGDNTTYIYKVDSSTTYPYDKVDMNKVLSAVNPDKPGLNLMTCTGDTIDGTTDLDQRLVVFTSQVQ